MKKLVLPIFILFISFLVLPTFVYPANAQPKSITCEEWIELVLTKKCEFYAAASKGKDQTTDFDIWCLTGPGTCSEEGCTVDFEIRSRPPDYLAEFDWEKCGVVGEGVKPPAVSVDEIVQPETAKTSKQESNWLEFLGINPYQTWLRLQELVEVAEFYASGDLEESLEGGFLNLWGRKSIRQKDEEAVKAKEQVFEVVFGKDWREQLNQPKLDVKTEEEAWESPVSKEEPVIDVSGTSDTKRYSWDENSGAVVKSNDWEKIKFREPVEVGGLTKRTLELGEGAIEVKVRNNNPAENQFGVDAGWLGVTVSRTHFYVSKDPNGKFAIVSVYEGEVEVKTRDGKIVKVKPEGDKPGVVVVSKRLSIARLALVGVILATIVGGLVWLIRKKKPKQRR